MKRRSDYTGFKKICEYCHREYEDVVGRRLRYCSLKCFGLAKKNEYICKYCGTLYITTKTRNTKYCSRLCMFKDRIGKKRPAWIGKKISFSKLKGKTPSTGKHIRHLALWGRCRKQVLERDGFTCQICGKAGIEVHHIKTTRELPELGYVISNLVTLCKVCHGKTYGKEKDWERYFDSIKR